MMMVFCADTSLTRFPFPFLSFFASFFLWLVAQPLDTNRISSCKSSQPCCHPNIPRILYTVSTPNETPRWQRR
ncbi:hypothetical protein LX32DRAFT_156294 [Colletotrichum zoysiae]|uniref:Secreted protein n=1 Tax=Colletotrichum zoysiae TaxID=1216348 RepID=A0AAD9HR81_9PEZI|nr:hypothetical protein LX32DRAFT_156294 [Colletotrichum zoysiae]